MMHHVMVPYVMVTCAAHRSLGRDRLGTVRRRLRIGSRLLDASRSRLGLLRSRGSALRGSLSRRSRLLGLVRGIHRPLSRIRRLGAAHH